MADDEKAVQNTEKDAENTSQNDEKVNDSGKDAKKRPKAKSKAKDEKEEEESSEEEEQFGLFDKPLVLEGKRQRKKTDFLVKDQQEIKKPLPIVFNGKGESLGSMEVVTHELSRCSALELKPLHKLLFGRDGRSVEIKKNIRLFNGFNIEKDTKEYENKQFGLERFTNEGLRRLLEILDLEKRGSREDLKERVFGFLLKPKETGRSLKATEKKADKKSRSKAGKSRKRKRTASKTKKSTKAKDEKESDKESDEESEEEEEQEEKEEEPEEPKKKKAKVGTPSKAKPSPSKAKQKTTSRSKKEPPKEEKKDTKKDSKGKKTPKKSKPVTVKITAGKRSPKKTPEKVKAPVEEVESSDDEPLAKKIKKQEEPTNVELAETVKDLLKDANFDEVTVKSISKQVFAKYPEFDLSEKKGFIKETVYSVISGDAD